MSSDDSRLAYMAHTGRAPGVVFLGGLRSSMHSVKAQAIAAHCRKHHRSCLRFDYYGHGASDGVFEQGTIGRWTRDTQDLLDRLGEGPQFLVGSSLGAWVALLVAMRRPEKVAGVLCLAAAVDFTEHLYHALFNDAQRTQLREEGRVALPDCHGGEPFVIADDLIAEARNHLLLPKPQLDIDAPVCFVHGQCDQDVPWQNSLELAARLKSSGVQVHLIKDGRHELDRPRDMDTWLRLMDGLVAGA